MSNNEITRGADGGPADAVSLDVQATNTKFRGAGQRRRMTKQRTVAANIKASVEIGVVSISDRNNDVMLTVRLEDMTAVLAAAYAAAKEVEECNSAKIEAASEAAPDAEKE